MSVYSNQINVRLSEVATLIFNHVLPDNTVTVAQVVVPVALLETLPKFFQDTIDQHKENMAADRAKMS